MARMLELPPAIRAWLVGLLEQAWPEPAPVIAAIPDALPEGEVHRLAGGGPYGRILDGRLDEIDGRIALEVLENSRMSGEEYFRVWGDGTIEPLDPAPRIAWSHGPDDTPEQRAAAEAEYFEHNRSAYDVLRERGFF